MSYCGFTIDQEDVALEDDRLHEVGQQCPASGLMNIMKTTNKF